MFADLIQASAASRANLETLKYRGGFHKAKWPTGPHKRKLRPKRKATRRRCAAEKRSRASLRFDEIPKGDQAADLIQQAQEMNAALEVFY